MLLPLGLLVTNALFQVLTSKMARTEDPVTMHIYTGIGIVMLGGWLVFSHVPDTWSRIGMAMIAVCGALGAWWAVKEGRLRMEVID